MACKVSKPCTAMSVVILQSPEAQFYQMTSSDHQHQCRHNNCRHDDRNPVQIRPLCCLIRATCPVAPLTVRKEQNKIYTTKAQSY